VNKQRFIKNGAIQRYSKLEARLHLEPLSIADIAKCLHLTPMQAQKYKEYLFGDTGERAKTIYIEKWVRMQCAKIERWVAHYRWMETGKEKDAPKPPALTMAEREAARRKRIKADPHERDKYRSKVRLLRNMPAPDPLVQALFQKAPE
jgi:hypothetical protein